MIFADTLKTLYDSGVHLSILWFVEHRRSHKQHSYICSNRQQYIIWVFLLCQKSLDIKIIFCTVNISKHNYSLLICIAKNFIWTTLKMIFSIFRCFCTSDSRLSNIVQTIHQWKIIYSSFRWSLNLNFTKSTLMTGFVLQGHILFNCMYLLSTDKHNSSAVKIK